MGQALSALSDPVRREIVQLSTQSEGLPCNAFITAVPKSSASHHWRVLREAGLIRQELDGVQKRNYLRKAEFSKRFPGLLEAVLRARE